MEENHICHIANVQKNTYNAIQHKEKSTITDIFSQRIPIPVLPRTKNSHLKDSGESCRFVRLGPRDGKFYTLVSGET